MTDERRYDDREVDQIFAVAVRSEDAPVRLDPDGPGLTLRQLQEIGEEAGIHPERIADAARSLAARASHLPQKRSLGMPVSVGRVVPLSRRPTDAEWDTLVADFRDTFEAAGEPLEEGRARMWSNGALRVILERTLEGDQLRFTTVNRRFRSLNRMGATLATWGLVYLGMLAPEVLTSAGGLAGALSTLLPALIVTAGGLGFIGLSGITLPKWVEERDEQFERLAERAQALVSGPPVEHADT